jgi:hypothetical protein
VALGVRRALATLRAGFLAFADFVPALVLRGEVVFAVAIWGVLLFFLACARRLRIYAVGPRYPFFGIEHLFVTRSSRFVTTGC